MILSPVLLQPPVPIGHITGDVERETLMKRVFAFADYTLVHNIVGAPAMKCSPPLDVQAACRWACKFAARRREERLLFELAYDTRRHGHGAHRRPPVFAEGRPPMTPAADVVAFNATASAAETPAALAEPVTPVGKRFITLFTLANLGLFTGMFRAASLLLPRQVEMVSPNGKEAALALASASGTLAALLANPLVGALSDRTTSRLASGTSGPWAAL